MHHIHFHLPRRRIRDADRLIQSIKHHQGFAEAKVYWQPDFEEFRVELFIKGQHQSRADYFTPDKDDALGTAKAMVLAVKNPSLRQDSAFRSEWKPMSKSDFATQVKAKGGLVKVTQYGSDAEKEGRLIGSWRKPTTVKGSPEYNVYEPGIGWVQDESGYIPMTYSEWYRRVLRKSASVLHKEWGYEATLSNRTIGAWIAPPNPKGSAFDLGQGFVKDAQGSDDLAYFVYIPGEGDYHIPGNHRSIEQARQAALAMMRTKKKDPKYFLPGGARIWRGDLDEFHGDAY